jgi:small subunit ribosomal protein S4
MGDIKRFRKKYTTPMHPWNATRIKLERTIKSKYGVANKREIWKMESVLTAFKDQAKRLLTRADEQANKEREQLKSRMIRMGLIGSGGGVDDILGLQLKDVMNRRLQTIVVKRRMARTVHHARQMIVHEHITVGGKKITSPSYLVPAAEEATISFAADSPFMQEGHPEAFNEEIAQRKSARDKARGRKGDRGDEIIVFDAVEDPEEKIKETEVVASVEDLKVDETEDKKEEAQP